MKDSGSLPGPASLWCGALLFSSVLVLRLQLHATVSPLRKQVFLLIGSGGSLLSLTLLWYNALLFSSVLVLRLRLHCTAAT